MKNIIFLISCNLLLYAMSTLAVLLITEFSIGTVFRSTQLHQLYFSGRDKIMIEDA